MLKSTLAIATALALAAAAGAASAQQPAASVRQACQADFEKLCSNLSPGERPRQCMRAHRSELSSDCKEALAKAKAARDANKAPGGSAGAS